MAKVEFTVRDMYVREVSDGLRMYATKDAEVLPIPERPHFKKVVFTVTTQEVAMKRAALNAFSIFGKSRPDDPTENCTCACHHGDSLACLGKKCCSEAGHRQLSAGWV